MADLCDHKKPKGLAFPRMMAMALSRELTGATFPQIGRAFKRDHSTAINSFRRDKEFQATDAEWRWARMCVIAAIPSVTAARLAEASALRESIAAGGSLVAPRQPASEPLVSVG
jgi:hypothetical protein